MKPLAVTVLITQTVFYLGASSKAAKVSERNVKRMTGLLFTSSAAATGLATAVIWKAGHGRF